MKSKLRNLLLAAMALTLFAGCSNIALNDAAVEGSDAGDKCVLTISYSDLEGILSESSASANGSARTIDPGVYTPGDGTTFKIKGVSSRNNVYTKDPVTFDENGEATIDLEYDEWYLTLSAWEGTNEILRGVTTVDLKKAVPQIEFTLSTKGVDTVGSLKITVNGLTEVVQSYEAGLYDIHTDELKYNLVVDSNGDVQPNGADLNDGKAETTTITSVSLEKEDIVPGSYIFKFIPYNNTVEKVAVREDLTPWSDVITIAPGRETSAEVTIEPMVAPIEPSDFTVSLVNSSKDDNDDFYTVHLEWKDGSTNEENFVLRIYETKVDVKDDGTDVDEANRKTALQKILKDENCIATFDMTEDLDNKVYKFMSDNNPYFVSGTLGMSTKECELKLPTGHLYEFTLTAKNRVGESAVCPRKASSDTSDLTGYAVNTRINLQKITYHLMGGTRITGAYGVNPIESKADIVEYQIYGAEDYDDDLLKITGTTAAAAVGDTPATPNDKLIWNDHPFVGWTLTPGGELIDPATKSKAAPDKFKDFVVYASYNKNVNLKYDIKDEYKTLDVTLSIDVDENSNADNTVLDLDNNTLKIYTQKKDANNQIISSGVLADVLKFTINGLKSKDANGNFVKGSDNKVIVTPTECDKIIILINGTVVAARDNEKVYENYTLNNFLGSGVYNITVIAQIGDYYYSNEPIALTVDFLTLKE